MSSDKMTESKAPSCPCGKCHCEICGNQMSRSSIDAEVERLRSQNKIMRDALEIIGDGKAPFDYHNVELRRLAREALGRIK